MNLCLVVMAFIFHKGSSNRDPLPDEGVKEVGFHGVIVYVVVGFYFTLHSTILICSAHSIRQQPAVESVWHNVEAPVSISGPGVPCYLTRQLLAVSYFIPSEYAHVVSPWFRFSCNPSLPVAWGLLMLHNHP